MREAEEMDFKRQSFEAEGFQGFFTVSDLRNGKINEVPRRAGVYIVLRELDYAPTFLEKSSGGWFKGKDPTVRKALLIANWVAGAHVIYIGKGEGAEGIRQRLKQFLKFGAGQAIGHWGGRLVWQIENSSQFVVVWKCVGSGESARELETSLFKSFAEICGDLW